jgi:hypothetical protein
MAVQPFENALWQRGIKFSIVQHMPRLPKHMRWHSWIEHCNTHTACKPQLDVRILKLGWLESALDRIWWCVCSCPHTSVLSCKLDNCFQILSRELNRLHDAPRC